MVLKESCSCRCCNKDTHVSCWTRVVSFGDIISGVVYKSLSPKGLLVQVLFWGLGVAFGDHFVIIYFHGVENQRHGHNWPTFQLFNA